MVPVFKDGPLEAALYWRKQFNELAQSKLFNADAKFTMLFSFLSGEDKENWIDAQDQSWGNAANATETRFLSAMNRFIGLCGAASNTTEYLRAFLMNAKKPAKMKLQDFKSRLFEFNRYLPFLPGPLNEKLGDAVLQHSQGMCSSPERPLYQCQCSRKCQKCSCSHGIL